MDTITFGQLINEIFEVYEAHYCDADIAAVATEATLNDLFFEAAIVTDRKTTDRASALAA